MKLETEIENASPNALRDLLLLLTHLTSLIKKKLGLPSSPNSHTDSHLTPDQQERIRRGGTEGPVSTGEPNRELTRERKNRIDRRDRRGGSWVRDTWEEGPKTHAYKAFDDLSNLR